MKRNKSIFMLATVALLALTLSGCLGMFKKEPPAPKKGSLVGTVSISGGDAIAGAKVTIDSESVTTNASGSYEFKELTYGNYTVKVQVDGALVNETSVAINKETTTLNIALVSGLVSAGKPYEYPDAQPSENNPDNDKTKLTDGLVGRPTEYWHSGWVATRPSDPWSVILDLGANTLIDSVRSHHFSGAAGIAWPVAVSVSVSKDKTTWTAPVELPITDAIPGEGTGKWFSIDDIGEVGRYVKVTWHVKPGGQHVWVGEVEVYGY